MLAAAGCGTDPGPTGPLTAHATHYDLALDLDSRAAHSKVTLVAETAGNCLTLPFRADSLTAVAFDGRPGDGTQNADQTLTICGDGVAQGATFTVEADDTVPLKTLSTSQVGFSVSNDTDGNQLTYLISWVDGCDQFGPCDHRPDQFATYTFDVTHGADTMVRCPGDVTDPNPTETICDFEHDGGPTYSTFGLIGYTAAPGPTGGWTQTDKGTWSGVHVTVYDRASTGIAAAIDPAFHAGFLDFMQGEFGPYPFGGELRVLTAPTYWDGFEHPGNIVLDDHLAKQANSYTHPVQHVLDHEMTHMWAGNQTTIASTYDFVWKEAMAEYLAFVYEDMTDPTVALRTSEIWKADSKVAKYWPVPLDQPALFDYYTDVYGPGPMVLFHQLEVLSSRDAVLAALHEVLGTPHALSVDQLVDALQRHTQLDLTDYVNAWIEGSGAPGWPLVHTAFTPGAAPGAMGSLAVAITNPTTPARGCKFHVALGDGGANSVEVAVDTFHDGPTQAIPVVQPAFTVSTVTLDPHHECLVFPSSTLAREGGVARGWRSQH
ncbi:MAG: M1 family aminopeptidase [Kofleriaceae bacterium]